MTATQQANPIELDDADKRTAREIFEQSVIDGATEAELKEARQLLVELLGCSPRQVHAITAHVTIGANRLREAAGLPASVTTRELLLIQRALDGGSVQEAIQTLEKKGIAADVVTAVHRSLLPADTQEPQTTDADELPGLPPVPRSAEEARTSDIEVREPNSGAAHANYDFNRKELWREAWRGFIGRHFTPAELADARVLCLPSIDPTREVRHYLELGIKPHNIIGVEGGDDVARTLFEKRARALGIVPVCARLEEYLPTVSQRFDIVNLDFPGQICPAYWKIMQSVPTSGRAALIVNIMAGREHARTQSALKLLHRHSTDEFQDELYAQLAKAPPTYEEALEHVARVAADLAHEPEDAPALSEVRDSTADRALLDQVGLGREDSIPKLYRSFFRELVALIAHGQDDRHTEVLERDAREACAIRANVMERVINNVLQGVQPGPPSISHPLAITALLGHSVPIAYERYRYLSEASSSHRPFISRFEMRVRPSETVLSEFKHTLRFLRESCLAQIRDGMLNAKANLVHHVAFVPADPSVALRGALSKRDQLVSLIGGKETARITLQRYCGDSYRFSAWLMAQLRGQDTPPPERKLLE